MPMAAGGKSFGAPSDDWAPTADSILLPVGRAPRLSKVGNLAQYLFLSKI